MSDTLPSRMNWYIPFTSSKVTIACLPSISICLTSPPPESLADWKYIIRSLLFVPFGNPVTRIREPSMLVSIWIKDKEKTFLLSIPRSSRNWRKCKCCLLGFFLVHQKLKSDWLIWYWDVTHWLSFVLPQLVLFSGKCCRTNRLVPRNHVTRKKHRICFIFNFWKYSYSNFFLLYYLCAWRKQFDFFVFQYQLLLFKKTLFQNRGFPCFSRKIIYANKDLGFRSI